MAGKRARGGSRWTGFRTGRSSQLAELARLLKPPSADTERVVRAQKRTAKKARSFKGSDDPAVAWEHKRTEAILRGEPDPGPWVENWLDEDV